MLARAVFHFQASTIFWFEEEKFNKIWTYYLAFVSFDKYLPKIDFWKNSTKVLNCEIDCSFTGTIAGTIVDQPVKAEELFDQSAPLGKKHASKKYD